MTTDNRLAWAEAAWRAYRPAFLEMLIGAGATDPAARWILDDLRPRVVELMMRAPMTIDAPEALRLDLERAIGASNGAAILQMIALERELYEARFGLGASAFAPADASKPN